MSNDRIPEQAGPEEKPEGVLPWEPPTVEELDYADTLAGAAPAGLPSDGPLNYS